MSAGGSTDREGDMQSRARVCNLRPMGQIQPVEPLDLSHGCGASAVFGAGEECQLRELFLCCCRDKQQWLQGPTAPLLLIQGRSLCPAAGKVYLYLT